jgi:hypothetical protein
LEPISACSQAEAYAAVAYGLKQITLSVDRPTSFHPVFRFSKEEVMASHIIRRQVLAGPWFATALWLAPSIAFAAGRFSAVGLANETQANLTISYRWGEEAWQKARLRPGARQWFDVL